MSYRNGGLRSIREAYAERDIPAPLLYCRDNPRVVVTWVARITAAALFVIGCIAAGGALSGATAGWTAIGLGAGAYALSSAGTKLKTKNIYLIVVRTLALAAFITVGALGGQGILSCSQVGWGVVGTSLIAGTFYATADKCKERFTRRREVRVL